MKVLSALICCLPLLACAQTSETSKVLKKALEKHPKADANGDGILTREEAKAFQEKAKELQKMQGAAMPESADKHVYKTVGEVKLPLWTHSQRMRRSIIQCPILSKNLGSKINR